MILMRTVSCYVAVNFKFCEVAFLFNLHYNNGILIYSIVNRCAPFVLLYTLCRNDSNCTPLHLLNEDSDDILELLDSNHLLPRANDPVLQENIIEVCVCPFL